MIWSRTQNRILNYEPKPSMSVNKNGYAVILAWPNTFCKKAGGWYDGLMDWLGITQNHFYRVGHAAILLVEKGTGNLHYFDFGRYHAPYQFGRVRSALTDPELKIHQKGQIDQNGNLTNLDNILLELSNKEACHGEGSLYATLMEITFEHALKKAKEMQNRGHIPYGPFTFRGSNCSRFVNEVAKAGKPAFWNMVKLITPFTLTPTPMSNVRSGMNTWIVEDKKPGIPDCKVNIGGVMLQPDRIPGIPKNAKWLAGEGAGSWFHFRACKDLITVTRFNPLGEIEFEDFFSSLGQKEFFPDEPFEISYPSHFGHITLVQFDSEIHLAKLNPKNHHEMYVQNLLLAYK